MITLACASDAKFYPFTATMLNSVFEHTAEPLAVYLLCDGLPDEVRRTFQRFVEGRGHRFHAVPLDTSSLDRLPVNGHASAANYYRLLLPEVLPLDVDRVLYLDSDLIVRRSLGTLWQQETSEAGVAAVRDFSYDETNERRLGFPTGHRYFNSGVLLIDLAAWRRAGVGQVIIDRIAQAPGVNVLWDQDGLNLVFAGAWKELPLEWNVQHGVFTDPRLRVRFARLAADPAIVHFTGTQKPWLRGPVHPFAGEFRYFYDRNPFKDRYRLWPGMCWNGARLAQRKIVDLSRAAARAAARIEPLWRNPVSRILRRLVEMRQAWTNEAGSLSTQAANAEVIRRLTSDLTVQDGPFKGLRYDDTSALGSMWSPKLLGCYEAELHPAIGTLLQMAWDAVLDIGCAEGYYAAGFAMVQRGPVIAYDIDPRARVACQRLAETNGVAGKVEVRDVFTLDELERLGPVERVLILCDCEGAEKHIFHENVPGFSRLSTCFLVIELHDFIELGVSSYLRDLFAPTHEIEFVSSVDDLIRPRVFPRRLIGSLSHEQQVSLQAEHRPRAMEWAIFRPKRAGGEQPREAAVEAVHDP